ncbi:MAG: HAMP domain-containing protein [Ignavibacteriales bacterium]|nr:HAMP domain-containing protein [Ignavibacteriales bacterium]
MFNKVSVKLILILCAVVLVNLGFYSYYTISKLKQDISLACTQNALNLSDIVKKSTRYSMLLNKREDIAQIINTVGTEKGVYAIKVYNKDGLVAYSSDSSEVGKIYDVKSPSCSPCHSQPQLPSNLPLEQMVRYFWNKDGQKVLGLINPIYNEKDCYTAECHYHSGDVKLLGLLDIQMSTDRVDNVVNSNVSGIVTSTIILTGVLALIIALFVNLMINVPLKKISTGIKEISRGNMNYKIPLESRDELGVIVKQFNNMSTSLDKAYKEIKDWSETLNMKVEEKNEELKKIYEQVVQIEKLASLGKLSATVAHELNNPLEGILTYSKLIARKLDKDNGTGQFDPLLKYLRLISDETSRCGRIVKDLLLFSHKEEGIFDNSNIRDIIEKSLMIINHHFEIHKVRLLTHYPQESIIVNCDRQRIEQVIVSVCINGIESMPDGGTLKVSLSSENMYCVIRIADEGKGISDKDLPNIFEPFYTTKSNGKGTGLGLAVVYGIIQQHKGNVTVESTSSRGTVFKIELPQLS